VAEVSPSSLTNGHGDNACMFLNLIADIAIQKHCKKQVMIYPTDTIEDNGSSELNDEADDESGIEVM
jgi:hypothetical protein